MKLSLHDEFPYRNKANSIQCGQIPVGIRPNAVPRARQVVSRCSTLWRPRYGSWNIGSVPFGCVFYGSRGVTFVMASQSNDCLQRPLSRYATMAIFAHALSDLTMYLGSLAA